MFRGRMASIGRGGVRVDNWGDALNTILKSALSCALLTAAPAFAQQTATPVPSPAAAISVAPANGSGSVLRVGTPVPLKMLETITTKGKKLRVGYRIHLEVSEDVKLGSVTVIPVGSPAIAEVTDVRNKGMWGKSGRINAQMLYLTVNGRQIRLSGQFDDKGVTGTAGVVAAVAFVPIAGFFTTGTSAKIEAGGAVKGFVDEDVPVVITAAPAAAPLTVAASASPAPALSAAATAQPAVVTSGPGEIARAGRLTEAN